MSLKTIRKFNKIKQTKNITKNVKEHSMNMIHPIYHNSSTNFRGEVRTTPNGNTYYATDMGGKFMGGMVAVNAILKLPTSPSKGGTLVGGAISTGISYALGNYVDNKRNEHAALATDYIHTVGTNKALQTHDRIEVADNGHLYYNSNDGRKYLTRFGAVAGGVSGLLGAMFTSFVMKHVPKMPKVPMAGALIAFPILGAGFGAICGWINGAITDWLNNRSARKHT